MLNFTLNQMVTCVALLAMLAIGSVKAEEVVFQTHLDRREGSEKNYELAIIATWNHGNRSYSETRHKDIRVRMIEVTDNGSVVGWTYKDASHKDAPGLKSLPGIHNHIKDIEILIELSNEGETKGIKNFELLKERIISGLTRDYMDTYDGKAELTEQDKREIKSSFGELFSTPSQLLEQLREVSLYFVTLEKELVLHKPLLFNLSNETFPKANDDSNTLTMELFKVNDSTGIVSISLDYNIDWKRISNAIGSDDNGLKPLISGRVDISNKHGWIVFASHAMKFDTKDFEYIQSVELRML